MKVIFKCMKYVQYFRGCFRRKLILLLLHDCIRTLSKWCEDSPMFVECHGYFFITAVALTVFFFREENEKIQSETALRNHRIV